MWQKLELELNGLQLLLFEDTCPIVSKLKYVLSKRVYPVQVPKFGSKCRWLVGLIPEELGSQVLI